MSKLGREPIHRTFVRYLEQSHERRLLNGQDLDEAVDAFVGLLLGDAQTRRLLGMIDAPCETDIDGRARRAVQNFLRLYRT